MKLKPYFQAHTNVVPTNQCLKQVLYKPSISGWLVKWAVKTREFYIKYKHRTVIKGQALENFVVEFTYAVSVLCVNQKGTKISIPDSHTPGPSIFTLILYVVRFSNTNGSGASLILTTPTLEQAKIEYALRFGFEASNNKA